MGGTCQRIAAAAWLAEMSATKHLRLMGAVLLASAAIVTVRAQAPVVAPAPVRER